MTQKYPNGEKVFAPGTVIVSAAGEVENIRKIVEPVLQPVAVEAQNIAPQQSTPIIYIEFSGGPWHLGGSSFAQVVNAVGTEVPGVEDAGYFARAFGAMQEMIREDLILAGHDISAGGMITTLLEMCFGRNDTGMNLDLTPLGESDNIRLLFSEKPGVIIQAADVEKVTEILKRYKADYAVIGTPSLSRTLNIRHNGHVFSFDINAFRDTWYRASYLLDRRQCGPKLAEKRLINYKSQELSYRFPKSFSGTFRQFGIEPSRRKPGGVKAAIIREKGVNGDREMAWMMHLAGFDVKDVHMTDLISGREDLKDLHFIVFVGGFSNSDVLGSAKGWAGAFLFNERAKQALDDFYARPDTLSLGICNGCQLMVELGLVYPEHAHHPKMLHNESGKFESAFLNVDIPENKSVMLTSLAGSRLGIWVAHGEGKFSMPFDEGKYHIPVRYSQSEYPGNPNGSDFAAAGLCSHDGRHLVMMPHLERAIYPWNWANYPSDRSLDEVSPWIEAFVNARKWVEEKS
jgi:phosphoribosylformylglycinamidine synthase